MRARPVSERAAQDDSEAEAASAGAAELFQVPEEPEPEPDDDAPSHPVTLPGPMLPGCEDCSLPVGLIGPTGLLGHVRP